MLTYETLKSFCADDEIRPALRFAHLDEGKWIATNACAIIVAPQALCHPDDIRFQDDELPESVGKFPNYKAVCRLDAKMEHTITTEDILQALDHCPKTDEMREVEKPINYIDCTCDECEDGEITLTDSTRWRGHYYDIEATCECPVCHGYGKIPDWKGYNPNEDDYNPEEDKTYFTIEPTGKKIPDLKNSLIGIKGVYFKAKHLALLLKVAGDMMVTEIHHSTPVAEKGLHIDISGIYCCIMPVYVDKKVKKNNTIIGL